MTVRGRLTKPNLLCPASRAETIDPLRGRQPSSSAWRELWLWSAAAAGYISLAGPRRPVPHPKGDQQLQQH
jgi:hypothetical protein